MQSGVPLHNNVGVLASDDPRQKFGHIDQFVHVALVRIEEAPAQGEELEALELKQSVDDSGHVVAAVVDGERDGEPLEGGHEGEVGHLPEFEAAEALGRLGLDGCQ